MKKVDIQNAGSQHDSVAIFEYQRGENGYIRYARLMTPAEYARLTEGVPHYRIHKAKHGVNVIFVDPVNSLGQFERQNKDEFVAAGYADRMWNNSKTIDYEMSVPLARLKRQVNITQPFADFINAERIAKKEAEARREKEIKEAARRKRAHQDRLKTISTRLHALGHAESRVVNAGWHDWSSEVEINIDTLSALIDAAEAARKLNVVA